MQDKKNREYYAVVDNKKWKTKKATSIFKLHKGLLGYFQTFQTGYQKIWCFTTVTMPT